MQHEQNPLDQFLKEQVENAHFDFDESYWEKASKMLDEQDQNDKKTAWWKRTGIVALFVTILLTVGYLITNKNNNNDKQLTQTNNKIQHTYELDEKLISIDINNENKEILKRDNKSLNTDNQLDNNYISSNNLSNFDKKNTSNTETIEKIPANESDAKQKNTSTEKEIVSEITKINTKKNSRLIARIKNKAANDINRSKMEEGNAKSEDLTNNGIEQKNKVWVNNQWMTPMDTQILYTPNPIDPSISNPRLVPALKDYVAHKNDSTVISYHFIKDTVTSPIFSKIEKDTALVSSKLSTLYLFLQLSAAINKGFEGNLHSNTTWGFSPLLSLGFGKKINNRISFIVQPGLTYFNAVNMEKKTRSYIYSFGIDSNDFVVSYKKMYQLQLPVGVQYHIFNKQSLLAMIGLSYILNVENKIEDQRISYNTTGYRDGINPLDIFMQLGYNYQINNRFILQAAYYQGFNNLTQQEYFNTQNKNKQKGILLSVRYNFIKK